MLKDNKKFDYQDSKETLDNVREKFNNSESILSEESIRDLIRKEVLQTGQTNNEQDKYQQYRQQGRFGINDQQFENKKVTFNEDQIKQPNKTRLNRDIQGFGIQQNRNDDFNEDFELDEAMNEDLRNTVYFEEIPNQKHTVKQYNSTLWDEILLFYDKNDLNSCYQIVLNEEDDVYLIKLMMLTGPCMKQLEINTSKKLMQRMCMILDSKFLEKMYLNVFEHSLQERILDNLTVVEQKKLTNEVYKLTSSSNSQVGEQSADLYIRLAQKFTSNF